MCRTRSAHRGESTISKAAFDQLYEAHFKDVWHALRRLGVYDKDLPDAVHDVFLVAHRHWSTFDASGPARPWLLGIAHKVAANQRRKAARREVHEDAAPPVASTAPGADAMVDASDKRALVSAALAQLDEHKRCVLVLHDVEELAMPQVAAMLEVPVNTAYSRLRLAREQFEKVIRKLTRQQGAA